jgi:hypothetical protein
MNDTEKSEQPKEQSSEQESAALRRTWEQNYGSRNSDGYSPASVRAQNILCGRDPNWRPDW